MTDNDDELAELNYCDVLFNSFQAIFEALVGAQEVIGIHDDIHETVQRRHVNSHFG